MKGYKYHSGATEIPEAIPQYIFQESSKPRTAFCKAKRVRKIFSYILQKRDDSVNDCTEAYQGPCKEGEREHAVCEYRA